MIPGLGFLAWGPGPGGPGLGALAWGPWPWGPGLGSWPEGPRRGGTDGWTKYPLYSTGHRPSEAAAQKGISLAIGLLPKKWKMNEIYEKTNDKVHQLCVSGIYRRSLKILLQIAVAHLNVWFLEFSAKRIPRASQDVDYSIFQPSGMKTACYLRLGGKDVKCMI